MTNKTEKQEVFDLFIRINSLAQPLFYNPNAEKENTSLDAKKIIHLSRAAAFCSVPIERKSFQNELDSLINPEPETVDINFTLSEICLISKALILYKQSKDAEEFIENSYGDSNIKNTRWAQVAEMMFLKKPNEKLCKDRSNELIDYCNLVNSGIEPREASEKVYKKNFVGKEIGGTDYIYGLKAFDKFLERAIKKERFNKDIANTKPPHRRPIG